MQTQRELIEQLREGRLSAYRASPGDIKEHYGIEQIVLAGGYGYRQVLELVQNGADAILEAQASDVPLSEANRIDVLVRKSCLYVANTGAALSREGIDALLRSHSSPKRANQIGRFGLGFKSLLRLGGRIDVFSTGVAMRFDPERCCRELCERFGVQFAPGLRLAWPLDESQERMDDPILNSFVGWAATVVRAEIKDGELFTHLQSEIRAFPSEFLLFLPVPVAVTLDDGANPKRVVRREFEGTDTLLHDGEKTSRWRVVEKSVSITDARARKDATHIHARETVPVTWAVPLDATREEAGRFWAFFPTNTPTRLPGILNAPWKLNSDRNAIISGEWNAALMSEAASLVAQALPGLATPEDPARPLDAFPRQMDRQDEDAAPLVQALWKHIETTRSVPNARADLCYPRDLWRHPQDSMELARDWSAAAVGQSEILVHPACLSRERNSRLAELHRRLAKAQPEDSAEPKNPNLGTRDAVLWFSAVATLDEAGALKALKLAEAYAHACALSEWNRVRPLLEIIPSDDQRLLKAESLIIAPPGAAMPELHQVAPFLRDNPEALRLLLELMKVRQLDDNTWRSLLHEALSPIEAKIRATGHANAEWRTLWARLRLAPAVIRDQFISEKKNRIRVRRRDGCWVRFDEALLPGQLVASMAGESSNTRVLVDEGEHANDTVPLKQLGVADFPKGTHGPGPYKEVLGEGQSDLRDWLEARRTEFQGARRSYIEPTDFAMPHGRPLLRLLTGTPNARFTSHLLVCLQDPEFSGSIRLVHRTRPDHYNKPEAPHPLAWFVLEHGSFLIGDSAIPLRVVFSRRQQNAMALVPGWQELQPGLTALAAAVTDPPAPTPQELTSLWKAMFHHLATPATLTGDTLLSLWAGAARDAVVPEHLPGTQGKIALADVYVTASADLALRARRLNRTVITLDEHALSLWKEKGARHLDQLFKPSWNEMLGPPDLLLSAIPELGIVLREEPKKTAQSQSVAGLKLCLDGTVEPCPCLMWKSALHLDTEQLAMLPRSERLRLVINEISAAGWLKWDASESLRIICDKSVESRRAAVAAQTSLPGKLLEAVGNKGGPLREALGNLSRRPFIESCLPLQLAGLVIALLGTEALAKLRETLREEGLNPPSRWSNDEARAFVASLGFPPEYATSPHKHREAEEFISGPIYLPPLHDFQVEVDAGLCSLLRSGNGRRRAVVCLPTGGGKTRVLVQAGVDLVLKPEGDCRIVLWVAQTDELCEQAVQSFRQVWINRGATATDLRIVRLWGSNPNPEPPPPGMPVVVVASIQTLNSRVGKEDLAWLDKPGLVVVDECHHAITKSYTKLLRWLDAEAPKPGDAEKSEPPIIGLSATPFRGTDEIESARLARRFDNLLLPRNQENLYEQLRNQGVLAEADYESLQSPTQLLEAEAVQLSQLGEVWEGINVERVLDLINQRLAGDSVRNKILLERIQASTEKSILFFTNSVLHAEEMAAQLHLLGIRAAAVSGDTPSGARRDFLERFQRGEIRVLCNHTVLAAGFDAPKTDMVLIARQVFSPVRYMQMIGRGLRGEKNGGTPRCRLVTVLDNLGRFRDRHAYHYCARYFSTTVSDDRWAKVPPATNPPPPLADSPPLQFGRVFPPPPFASQGGGGGGAGV
jgi:superfamily II DNA or RNA helicase